MLLLLFLKSTIHCTVTEPSSRQNPCTSMPTLRQEQSSSKQTTSYCGQAAFHKQRSFDWRQLTVRTSCNQNNLNERSDCRLNSCIDWHRVGGGWKHKRKKLCDYIMQKHWLTNLSLFSGPQIFWLIAGGQCFPGNCSTTHQGRPWWLNPPSLPSTISQEYKHTDFTSYSLIPFVVLVCLFKFYSCLSDTLKNILHAASVWCSFGWGCFIKVRY